MADTQKSSQKLLITDWGSIPYPEAFQKQRDLVDQVIKGEAPEQIVFCTHPPVVTLGRGTRSGDVFGWTGETAEVNRGGRATYHGPNQLIMYPLVYVGKNQKNFLEKSFGANDLHAYMRTLEQSVIDVLVSYGVNSQSQPLQKQVGDDAEKEATGVWIGEQKIAAIGIAVKAWVTSHGVALNLWKDSQAFQGINPCGFRVDQVITLEDVLHRKVDRDDVIKLWTQSIQNRLLKAQ